MYALCDDMPCAVGRSLGMPAPAEWRTFLTVEDRVSVRAQIKAAYLASCTTFEELLTTAVAIEEELLHIGAPSRLDYFKNGFEFDSRVKLKRKQLATIVVPPPAESALSVSSCQDNDEGAPEKRSRA